MNIPPPGKSMIHQLSVKFDHLPKSKEHRLLKEENHYHEGSESGEEVENDLVCHLFGGNGFGYSLVLLMARNTGRSNLFSYSGLGNGISLIELAEAAWVTIS
ncbi:hypothetical protein Tco_1281878 [Tanacetum coccineum]